MSILSEQLITAAIGLIVLYFVNYGLYNLYFHPLAKYPGPVLWRLTQLTYMRSMYTGWLHRDNLAIHEQYGDVVRIAPDELSYINPEAWHDIYTHRNGTPPFPKFKVWFNPRKGRSMSLISAIDPKDHTRLRKALQPGFSEATVLMQEGIIRSYVDQLMARLDKLCTENPSGSAVVDIVKWYNYTIFDIIGDLAFGETFHCLERSEYHPWMSIIFNSFRAAVLSAMLRFHPSLDRVFALFIPADVKVKYAKHYQYFKDSVEKQLAIQTERPDFMSLIEKGSDKDDGEGLPRGEIDANAQLFVTAGSETTSTTISGITNYLVKSPGVLERLMEEVRRECPSQVDITISRLRSLPYLNAVLNEGFRMCNPTPIGTPHVVPSSGATVCGEEVPSNTVVNVVSLGIGLSPKHLHEPIVFHPERWLAASRSNTASPFYNDQHSSVKVFGIGSRVCIGQSLAKAELTLILANLLWKFDISEVNSDAGLLRWEDQRSFFVTEKRPFEIQMKLRAQS